MTGFAKPPLHGVRVIDLSRALAGPYAAMMLADLGADVIKVERPVVGDETRQWGPPFAGVGPDRESTYFLSVNRGKRSIAADLKRPEDFNSVLELITSADVLIENFRHGVMDRLGLGAERLLSINPRLIILSISGFGTAGGDATRAGYDQILQAEGGIMSVTGPERGCPTKVGVPIADLGSGLIGTIGVLAALHARDRSGKGQAVSTSLLASQIALHTFQGTRWLVAGEVPGPSGNHHPTVSPYGTFPTATAQIVIAVGNDAIWQRFAGLVGLDPGDSRYLTNQLRVEHREELHQEIAQSLKVKPAGDWLPALNSAGVPAGEVKTIDRVYASGQVQAEDLVMAVSHASLGEIQLPGMPLKFGSSPTPNPAAPPTLGQHTSEIKETGGWL